MSNYVTKKELDHATDVDTSDIAVKEDFIALKTEVDKFGINKLVNVPTNLNNLKANVDDLDIGKLKTVPIDLEKFSDVVNKEIVKNEKFYTIKIKVNNFEKKSPDITSLIHISQYNTKFEEKNSDVDKKY